MRGPAAEADAYAVVPAGAEHVAALPAVERAAAALFPEDDLPGILRDEALPESTLRRAQEDGRLWVALAPSGAPVGFALAGMVDGEAHLEELDVHPDHGGRGLGTRLVRAVAAWAAREGCAVLTLTTFRHLPWNAPFYAGLGFEEIPADRLSPGLAAALEAEARHGLPPDRRVAMRLRLADV